MSSKSPIELVARVMAISFSFVQPATFSTGDTGVPSAFGTLAGEASTSAVRPARAP